MISPLTLHDWLARDPILVTAIGDWDLWQFFEACGHERTLSCRDGSLITRIQKRVRSCDLIFLRKVGTGGKYQGMICCFWLVLRITLPNRELHTLCCPLLGHLRAVLSRLRRDRTIRGKTKQKYSAFKATMKLLLFYLGFFEDSCLCDDTLDKLLSYSRPLQRKSHQ